MKKTLAMLMLVGGLAACNQEKIEKLEMESADLKKVAADRDSVIAALMSDLVGIEEDLKAIRVKEKSIDVATTEGTSEEDVREKNQKRHYLHQHHHGREQGPDR
ncbi:MAG: hypothetical protein HC842_09935 [Cytophagales bacterium]|nr:hypothetical protein [Cytophagales bacterium]